MSLIYVFDVYRSGYGLGLRHSHAGARRRANWELILFRPLIWVPLVNTASYLEGYQSGYRDGAASNALTMQLGDRFLPPH